MTKKSPTIELKVNNLVEFPPLNERVAQAFRDALAKSTTLAALAVGELPAVAEAAALLARRSAEYALRCRTDAHRVFRSGDDYVCVICGKRFTLIE